MLQIDINKILPVTEARAKIARVVDEVSRGDIYVLTRGGKPVAVVAPINCIDQLTIGGVKKEELPAIKEKPVVAVEKPPEVHQSVVVPPKAEKLPQGIDLDKVGKALSNSDS